MAKNLVELGTIALMVDPAPIWKRKIVSPITRTREIFFQGFTTVMCDELVNEEIIRYSDLKGGGDIL